MIVKRLWIKHKYHRCDSTWRGWFLFGIIPLYIEQLSKE